MKESYLTKVRKDQALRIPNSVMEVLKLEPNTSVRVTIEVL